MIASVSTQHLSASRGAAHATTTRSLAAIRDFLEAYSIDIAAVDAAALLARAESLPPGMEVFVSALPEQSLTATVEACLTLRNAGLTPVPHVCARNHHRASLDRYLDALASQAGVEAAVVVGGNMERDVTAGVFDSAIEAIATGLFVKHGILRVGLAGYPDGHRLISNTTLRQSLADKLRACRSVGIEPFVVTQFSFDPARIRTWSEMFLNTHPGVPLVVGLAGPARRATLMRYAQRAAA